MKISFNRLAALTAIAVLAFGAAPAPSAGQAQANNRPAAAANPADQPVTTMSVQVKVVNVLATVRDKHGMIVRD